MDIKALPDAQDVDRAILDKFARELPLHIERIMLFAKYRRGAYLAYLNEGFTEEQALELCKQI